MPDIDMSHIDQYLTDYGISYQNFEFVGKKIFKPKMVGKQSDRYPIRGFERFKVHRIDRAPGAASPEMDPWRLSNDNYFCAGKGQKARAKAALMEELKSAGAVNSQTIYKRRERKIEPKEVQ